MNVFVARVGTQATAETDLSHAVDEWTRRLPFERARTRSWRSPDGHTVAAWVTHRPELVGGVTYAAVRKAALALFDGRPILWSSDHSADGIRTLDASLYLDPPSDWLERLDGRYAVLRFLDGRLQVVTDALGSYPVYFTRLGPHRLISNSAHLLVALTGEGRHDESAVAHLLSAGFSAMDRPLWQGIERLEPGSVHTFLGSAHTRASTLTEQEIASWFGQGWDPDHAAALVTAAASALIDWPGRECEVSATGGRDSRVVLAAAATSGKPLISQTIAFPDQPGFPRTQDVSVASRICSELNVPHEIRTLDSTFGLYQDPADLAEALRVRGPGTIALNDAATMRFTPTSRPLPLTMSGLGGELARAFYGHHSGGGATTAAAYLHGRTAYTWPQPVTSQRARTRVLSDLEQWCRRWIRAGTGSPDLSDAFYLQRLRTWAAHGVFTWATHEDLVSPLWIRRLLPLQFGLTREERRLEVFHLEVLRRLAPSLVSVPFEATKPRWPAEQGLVARRLQRAQVLAYKGRKYALRRINATVNRVPEHDPFPAIHAYLREVAERASPEAWEHLDRARVDELLCQNPAGMHARARHQVSRLATVLS